MQFFPGELLKEFPGPLFHHPIQFRKHVQPMGSDVRPDDPAIVPVALLAEEFLYLQAAQQAGNIRLGCNHHAADGRAGEPCWLRPAQDAQDVKLRQGEPGGLQPLLHGPMQAVRGAHQVEQRLLVGTGEAVRLPGSLGVRCHCSSPDAALPLHALIVNYPDDKYRDYRYRDYID
jgi:hypothetical protein